MLNVRPGCTADINRKAEYYIKQSGFSQRHDEIKVMLITLFSSFEVKGDQVFISTTENTNRQKIGETKGFKAGDSFQKSEPLPRIDLSISKIEDGAVHCRYFYQAPKIGLLNYSENGEVVIRDKEDDEK